MFGDGFELATITRTDPDGLALVVVRSSWTERENLLVDAKEAELVVFRRWQEFHRRRSDSRRAGSPTSADATR
jgi:hypothetical protein